MSVTIQDVADRAGVSKATVSKVLNHNPSIPEVTAERIRNLMQQMDYHPNTRARNFAKQSTKQIVFAVELSKNEAFKHPHMFEIMVGLQQALSSKNYSMVIVSVNKETCMNVLGDMIAQKSIDGVVIHISCLTKELEKLIMEKQFPHIVLGSPGNKTQLCWLDNNNILSGEMAASYLLCKGYQKIGFLGGQKSDKGSSDRLQGYYNVLEAHKLFIDPLLVTAGDSTIASGEQMMKHLLKRVPDLDAVICANNSLALGAYYAVLSLGLRIPEQIGLITFDAYPYTSITRPKLTTVDIDVFDLGRQAGELLLRKIKKPNFQVKSYTTLASLIRHGSTR